MRKKEENIVKRTLDLKNPPPLSAEQKARLDAVAGDQAFAHGRAQVLQVGVELRDDGLGRRLQFGEMIALRADQVAHPVGRRLRRRGGQAVRPLEGAHVDHAAAIQIGAIEAGHGFGLGAALSVDALLKLLGGGALGKKLFTIPEGSDGMKVDAKGNLYTAHGKVKVYDPAGKLLEAIEVPEAPANLCFGGDDYKTLFITARTSLYSVRMKNAGAKPLGAKW